MCVCVCKSRFHVYVTADTMDIAGRTRVSSDNFRANIFDKRRLRDKSFHFPLARARNLYLLFWPWQGASLRTVRTEAGESAHDFYCGQTEQCTNGVTSFCRRPAHTRVRIILNERTHATCAVGRLVSWSVITRAILFIRSARVQNACLP